MNVFLIVGSCDNMTFTLYIVSSCYTGITTWLPNQEAACCKWRWLTHSVITRVRKVTRLAETDVLQRLMRHTLLRTQKQGECVWLNKGEKGCYDPIKEGKKLFIASSFEETLTKLPFLKSCRILQTQIQPQQSITMSDNDFFPQSYICICCWVSGKLFTV